MNSENIKRLEELKREIKSIKEQERKYKTEVLKNGVSVGLKVTGLLVGLPPYILVKYVSSSVLEKKSFRLQAKGFSNLAAYMFTHKHSYADRGWDYLHQANVLDDQISKEKENGRSR